MDENMSVRERFLHLEGAGLSEDIWLGCFYCRVTGSSFSFLEWILEKAE